MAELKPCPFCGGAAELWVPGGPIVCTDPDCEARAPNAEVWNRRPAVADRAALLQEVWDELDKAYAATDPASPTRRGLSTAASIVAIMKRTAGVPAAQGGTDGR